MADWEMDETKGPAGALYVATIKDFISYDILGAINIALRLIDDKNVIILDKTFQLAKKRLREYTKDFPETIRATNELLAKKPENTKDPMYALAFFHLNPQRENIDAQTFVNTDTKWTIKDASLIDMIALTLALYPTMQPRARAALMTAIHLYYIEAAESIPFKITINTDLAIQLHARTTQFP